MFEYSRRRESVFICPLEMGEPTDVPSYLKYGKKINRSQIPLSKASKRNFTIVTWIFNILTPK